MIGLFDRIMNKRYTRYFFLFCFIFVFPSWAFVAVDEPIDFEVFDIDNNKHHLFQYLSQGKYVLLEFNTPG